MIVILDVRLEMRSQKQCIKPKPETASLMPIPYFDNSNLWQAFETMNGLVSPKDKNRIKYQKANFILF